MKSSTNSSSKKAAEATYQINELMVEGELLLIYQDNFRDVELANLLRFAENKITSQEETKKFKKRVFHVLVECVQNISRHQSTPINPSQSSSILAIAKNEHSYSILTGNAIAKEKVSLLKAKIDHLNTLNKEQLKEVYLQTMKNDEHSSSGGAGLGLIDMLRKSKHKIKYDFVHLDDKNDFISLRVTLGL